MNGLERVIDIIRKDFSKGVNYLNIDGAPVLFWFWSGAYDEDKNFCSFLSEATASFRNIAVALRLPGGVGDEKMTFKFFQWFAPFSPLELAAEKN